MPKAKSVKPRTEIRGIGWKKTTTIPTARYEVISKAILRALTAEPVKFAQLVERVAARLPDFEGSVSWYTITCARELEVRGLIKRHTNPVLYSKPRSRRTGPAKPPGKVRSAVRSDT